MGSSKLKIPISYDLGFPLLGIYPEKFKFVYQRDSYTFMFFSLPFSQSQDTESSLISEWKWIKKTYKPIIEYYSITRKKEILFCVNKEDEHEELYI